MSNLQPFQFPIPEGYEVVTRSGEKVTQLTKFECDSITPYRGVFNGAVQSWHKHGEYAYNNECERDLFLRPIPRERWVVVVDRNSHVWAASVNEYDSEADISKEHTQMAYPDAKVSIHKITLP